MFKTDNHHIFPEACVIQHCVNTIYALVTVLLFCVAIGIQELTPLPFVENV